MLRQIAPVFFTTDIPATLAYYTGKLASQFGTCRIRRSTPSLARDQQGDSFPLPPPRPPPIRTNTRDELLDAYVFVEDADALYAEYAGPRRRFTRGLGNMPWHCREFVV